MSRFGDEIAALTPEARARLEERLRRRSRPSSTTSRIPRRERVGEAPVSFAQERLLFLDELSPGSSVYNVVTALRLEGALDEAALEGSLADVVGRHEILRTRFEGSTEREAVARQIVSECFGSVLRRLGLSDSDPSERDARVKAALEEEARRPFDLEKGPLFRALLICLGETEHVLELTLHHAVCDGWSLGVLVRDLWSFYEARVDGRSAPLAELSIQYGDYAAWQRGWLTGRELARQVSFWKETLAGPLPEVEIPTDRPRPRQASFEGAHETFQLPGDLTVAIQALARAEEATLHMALLAGFLAVLSRWSGQEDVVLGSAVSGRHWSEVSDLIGPFANTLPLRFDLGGDPSFRELLRRVRTLVLDAYGHQDVPLEKLVAEIAPERDPARNPFFQMVLAFQVSPESAVSAASLAKQSVPSMTRVPVESGRAHLDLALTLSETSEGISGALEYRTDLFERSTIARVLGSLKRLLTGAVEDARTRLSELPLLSVEELTLLDEISGRSRVRAFDTDVVNLFEEALAKAGDQVAVASEEGDLTYRELSARAKGIAWTLYERGVGAADVVSVLLPRSLDVIASLVGTAMSGAAYLALEASYPLDRLRFMIRDAAVRWVLTDRDVWSKSGMAEEASALGITPLFVDEIAERRDTPRVCLAPDRILYVTYTSGSTGLPKGVEVTHRNVVRLVRDQEYATLDEGSRILQLAPLSFDASTFEIWGALANGGAVVLYPERVPTARELELFLRRRAVTTMWLTAGLFNALVDESPSCLASLGEVLVGGEALSVAHVRRAISACPDTRFINGYGPTEGTTFTTCHSIDRELPETASSIPIGEVLTGSRVYVLDAQANRLPLGAPGELFIGGAGVARGYRARPELSAERFLPDPYAGAPGARMYRTGDRVRLLPDGTLDYLGRLDEQVKLRGYRVEPGEVESVLESQEGVREAAVIVGEDERGERRLLGYVVLEEPTTRETGATRSVVDALRDALSARLPDYMLPQALVVLASLPLTSNGKLDRDALPRPEWGVRASAARVLPRGPVEESIAEIWMDLLGTDAVGVHDDFFDLGGHSLLAMRLATRLRGLFQVGLPLRAIFEAPTIAGLAALVEASRREGILPSAPPLVPAPRTRSLAPRPLSFAQQRLWLLDQMTGASPAYHVSAALRMRGRLHEDALRRALDAIVERHEALRTSFRLLEDAPVQHVAAATSFPLPSVDLSGLAVSRRDETTRLALRERAREPFDLTHGPLVRGLLLKLGAEEHVLQVTMHHIVSDGWSIGIFFRELSVLYDAFTEGKTSPLAPLAVQYGDYASWQRLWLDEETLGRLSSYWRGELAPVLEGCELPLDRPRPASPRLRGGRRTLTFSKELTRGLEEWSRSEGATLFMMLLTGFHGLVHRWTGRDRLVVGTPIANRSASEIENLIGFFANILPLAADLSGRPSFREALGRIREGTLDAYAHQDVPFERIVEELAPERDWGRNPLFQITIALQTAPVEPPRLAGLTLGGVESSAGATRFDLEVHLWNTPEGLRAIASYDAELFFPETIERFLEHYRALLEGALREPDRPLDEIPVLTASERRVLADWNDRRREYPRDATLPELFAARVREAGDHPALAFGSESLTYRELDERSERLARRLRALGVRPETRVGVLGERSIPLYVAVVAVTKSGGAYVPLDPSYPKERLRFMIEDSGLEVLLVDGGSRTALPDTDVPVVDWRAEPSAPSAKDEGVFPEPVPLRAENLAYVMYTSGSTGVPKGVSVTHRAVLRLVSNTNYLELGPEDRVAQAASFSFDATTFELWAPLLAGATVVGLEKNATLEPLELGRALREERLSVLFLTTALFRQMVRDARESLAGLRTLLFGGELSDAESVRRLLTEGAPERLLHVYGPTESTTFASFYEVRSVDEDARTVPIGAPLANTELHVLDSRLGLAPLGVPGELYIGGDGVARGYWNRPELTAERFVPHPFAAEGERLYRTGDLVRWLPSGALEFLGRADSQVKLRGHRIELGEVEAALRSDPRVSDAVVLVREDRPSDRRLVAYVVGAEGAEAEPAEIRRALSNTLPDYMVPGAVVRLPALPLTPNGKLDREALPAPGHSVDETRDGFVAPRDALEEGLAEIWRDLLGVERVSVHEDFFSLGGHSLLATQLVSRMKKAFRVELRLRHLFEEPTIAELAARIAAIHRAGIVRDGSALSRRPRGEDLPLSFAQERLWFLSQLDPESVAYNIPAAFRLEGRLDAGALAWTLGEIRRRHEALRTVFATTSGRAVQKILEPETLGAPLEVVDLSGLDRVTRESEARRLSVAETRMVFDLSKGPLLRARLIRLDPSDHLLLLTVHHIVSDGWSYGVLFRELEMLYRARLEGPKGPPSPLEELPVQYADYAAWQREWLRGEVLDEQLDYWRSRLEDAVVLNLPTDRPRPAVQTFAGGKESLPISSSLRESAKELAKKEGVTLFMLLLGAFQSLLHRYSRQDDVVVGTPVANRTRQEIEGLIGFFANNLVLRVDFSGRPSFREVLSRVREIAVEAYTHQDLPFEKLVDEISPERSLSRSPLFQVVFALHATPGGGLSLVGTKARGQESGLRTTRFDLELYLWDHPQGITAVCFYNRDLFDGTTVARMLRHLRNLLESALAAPETPVAELPMLGASEREQLLFDGSGESAEAPKASPWKTLARAFEERVLAGPDRVALTLPTESGAKAELSYRELDARANRLAHRLRELGVGPESLVGLCLERSLELVTGIVAVLKAGGAYVPLDPSYPEERLNRMLEDSGASVVVTDSGHFASLHAYGGAAVLLDRDRERLERLPSTAPSALGEPENLAYVIYTSGSTGRPKGVGVTHRNVLRLFSSTAPGFGFDERDVFTLFHSYAFDFSVWELWGALLHGGRLVVVPYWVSRDPQAFHALLVRERVTVLNQTPSAFRGLMHADELSQEGELALRRVVFGGEALELGSLEPWTRRHGEERPLLVNMYGITETTVHVTSREIRREDVTSSTGSVIGRPIRDLTCYLLDESLEPVPIGVTGELYVGGEGLARGYLGRPARTAERFVPHPFSAEPGSRLYRTGDLGRRLANGDIEYLGRIDHQVKVRGFRIELGEIEAALTSHEAVREAVVRLASDGEGAGRLTAYVVPRSGEGRELVAELRGHVAQRLPEYMVPAAFVILETLPLTPEGKLDLRKLPELSAAGTTSLETTSASEPPASPAETILAVIWKDLLRLESIGTNDNFFELGGDSILSIQVVARAKDKGLGLTVRDLFQHQTIASLARVARRVEGVDAEQGLVTGEAPLTPVQRWFFEQDLEESHHYNQSMLLTLPEGFRGELLPAVLETLVLRHDALRLRFRRDSSGAVRAEYSGETTPSWRRVDTAGLSEEERRETITRSCSEAQASLDLERGPLARFLHFDAGASPPGEGRERGRLLVAIHHLVVDGVSWRILLEDLERIYRALAGGSTVPPLRKTTSYGKWARQLEEHARSAAVESEASYWLERLASPDAALPFPTDFSPSSGANREEHVAHVIGRLSEEETRSLLKELPARFRTEVNDVLLTALVEAACRFTGADALAVTLEGHGREELFDGCDLTRTVGWFTSLYPVVLTRLTGDGDDSLVALLRSVKEQLRKVPGKGVGYGLLRYLHPRFSQELGAFEASPISFNYLGQFDRTLGDEAFFGIAPEPMGSARSPRGERKHLIDVTAMVAGNRFQVDFMYAGALYRRETIEALSEAFLSALRSLVAAEDAPEMEAYTPSDFSLVDLDREKLEKFLSKRRGKRD